MHFIGEIFYWAIFIWFMYFSSLKFLNFAFSSLFIFIEFSSYVLNFLFHSALCLNFLWIHLWVYLHFDSIKYFYNHSFPLYVLVGFYLTHFNWEPSPYWELVFLLHCVYLLHVPFHVSYITEMTFLYLWLFCWLDLFLSVLLSFEIFQNLGGAKLWESWGE